MFRSSKIVLIQPLAGKAPNADLTTEIRWTLKLVLGGQPTHTRTHAETITDFSQYPLQGKYYNDDISSAANDYVIGGSDPESEKFWRYDVRNQKLLFCTVKEMTGGGAMSMDPNPLVVVDNIELYGMGLASNGFKLAESNRDFDTGFVNVASWTKPFAKRVIYWTVA